MSLWCVTFQCLVSHSCIWSANIRFLSHGNYHAFLTYYSYITGWWIQRFLCSWFGDTFLPQNYFRPFTCHLSHVNSPLHQLRTQIICRFTARKTLNKIFSIPNLKPYTYCKRRQSEIHLTNAAVIARGGEKRKKENKNTVKDKEKRPLKNQKNIMEMGKGIQKNLKKLGNAKKVCILWIHFPLKVRTWFFNQMIVKRQLKMNVWNAWKHMTSKADGIKCKMCCWWLHNTCSLQQPILPLW